MLTSQCETLKPTLTPNLYQNSSDDEAFHIAPLERSGNSRYLRVFTVTSEDLSHILTTFVIDPQLKYSYTLGLDIWPNDNIFYP